MSRKRDLFDSLCCSFIDSKLGLTVQETTCKRLKKCGQKVILKGMGMNRGYAVSRGLRRSSSPTGKWPPYFYNEQGLHRSGSPTESQ